MRIYLGKTIYIKKNFIKKLLILLGLNNRYTVLLIYYATYNNKKAIISANNPVASEKANPKIA